MADFRCRVADVILNGRVKRGSSVRALYYRLIASRFQRPASSPSFDHEVFVFDLVDLSVGEQWRLDTLEGRGAYVACGRGLSGYFSSNPSGITKRRVLAENWGSNVGSAACEVVGASRREGDDHHRDR